jgi:hypothetical protein
MYSNAVLEKALEKLRELEETIEPVRVKDVNLYIEKIERILEERTKKNESKRVL